MRSPDDYEPSAGVFHGTSGVILVVIGGWLLANLVEAPTFCLVAGLACLGAGTYLLVAGAVARGIQVARRAARTAQREPSSGQAASGS